MVLENLYENFFWTTTIYLPTLSEEAASISITTVALKVALCDDEHVTTSMR